MNGGVQELDDGDVESLVEYKGAIISGCASNCFQRIQVGRCSYLIAFSLPTSACVCLWFIALLMRESPKYKVFVCVTMEDYPL